MTSGRYDDLRIRPREDARLGGEGFHMNRSTRKFVAIGCVMLTLAALQIRYFESVSLPHVLAFFFATLAAGLMLGRALTLQRLGATPPEAIRRNPS